MLSTKCFYVYILTNQHRTVLYTGVTNDLKLRVEEHYSQRGQKSCFTGKYYAYYLLYFEAHRYINNAIAREKEIKGWVREKKMKLINEMNPSLRFLNEEVFGVWPPKEIESRLKS
jgi:putative endonuclease